MVHPRYYILRMEILCVELTSMAQWQTSVSQPLRYPQDSFFAQPGQERAYFGTFIVQIHSLRELIPATSSTVIEDIDGMRKRGLASVAFFYCDFRDDEKKDRRGLLSSLLLQLCDQSDSYSTVLSNFYTTHRRGTQAPTDSALAQCLKDIIKLPGQAPVYIILDALDECPNTSAMPTPREKVLKLVEDLVSSNLPNLHMCVTSRPEPDIKFVLDPLGFHPVSIHGESGQRQDIDNYIKSFVHTDPNMQNWKAEDKQLVMDVLAKKADGMYAICTITLHHSSS
jgi:hypothetical protein